MTTPRLTTLLGEKGTRTIGGREVTLRKATLAECGMFSSWVKSRAKREASIIDPQTPPESAALLAQMVMRDIGEGHYEPEAPGYCAALANPDGMAELLYIIVHHDDPAVTRDDIRGLIEQGLQDAFLAVLEAEGHDPNELGRVAALCGFPANWPSPSPSSSSASATPPSDTPPIPSAG